MKGSLFQFIIIAVCTLLIVAGVLVFAVLGGTFKGSSVGRVVIWGTADGLAMQNVLESLRQSDNAFEEVQYVEKNPESYPSELINAIASGQSPDLFLLPHSQALSFSDKVSVIPWDEVSENRFVNAFVDEGGLFLVEDGSLALPFLIDPLVMYWNRDLLASAGIADAPRYWNDLLAAAPRITAIDSSANISRSAAALGTWNNIGNAKAILSALLMQAGDPIVARRPEGGFAAALGSRPSGTPENPAESALRFYTEFANPSKTVYSWNRSLSRARDAFTAGNVGVYFGFASEYPELLSRNPNLRIGVALLPQAQGASTQLTYAEVTGLAVSRAAANPRGALAIAQKLSDPVGASLAGSALGLPPVRRDLLSMLPEEAVANVFARSALIARGWIDPNPAATGSIFQGMIESVLSGRAVPAEAVSAASRDLGALFSQTR